MIDPANILASPRINDDVEHDREQTSLDRDAFMKLLVTQLENQDPLDPVDSREMLTQLSELTSVEYLVGIESRLGSLEVTNAGIANSDAAQLIGQEVLVDGSRLVLDDTGSAEASFSLPAAAGDVTVTVRDAVGQIVREVPLGARGPGNHRFSWDGTTGDGVRGDPGNYTIAVTASTAEGQALVTSTDVRGIVSGVSYERGYPELHIGSNRALLGDVRSIGSTAGVKP